MRHTVVLTADLASGLPSLCAGAGPCTFWQTGPRTSTPSPPSAAGTALAEWVDAVTLAWGHPPGRVLLHEDRPVGHVLFAPAGLVPRLSAFAAAPSEPTTPVLLTVQTYDPADRPAITHQVSRLLVRLPSHTSTDPAAHHLLRLACHDVLRAGGSQLDAIATRHARPVTPVPTPERTAAGHPCLLAVGLLTDQGFRVERDHPRHPRLRLDLGTSLALRSGVQHAAHVVADRIRGAAAPPTPALDRT